MNMFTVLFAIPRTAGWLSHYTELSRPGQPDRTGPRQIYTGEPVRDYVPIVTR